MNTKPPAVVPIKTPKVKIADLEAAYEWLPVSPEAGLTMALSWFSQNAPALLYNDALDDNRKKAHERATKSLALGDQGITINERWTSYMTAIRLFESKVWPSKGLPKLDEALAAKTPRKYAKLAAFLEELGGLLQGIVTIAPTQMSTRLMINPSLKLMGIPVPELEKMMADGALKTLVLEAMTFAQASVADEKGNVDGDRFMNAMTTILNRIANQIASVKLAPVSVAPVVPAPVQQVPVVPAPVQVPVQAPVTSVTGTGNATAHLAAIDPFGRFRQGTAKAAVAATIASGAWVPMADLVAICDSMGITTGQIGVAFKQLTAHTGRTIEFRNDKKEVRIA